MLKLSRSLYKYFKNNYFIYMKIKSKVDLINFIKRKLGSPLINVELTDDMIEDNIDQAVQKFCDYAREGQQLENIILCEFHGKGSYPLPENITSIIKIGSNSTTNLTNFGSNFGKGYVPDLWSSQFFSNYSAHFTGCSTFSDGMFSDNLTGSIIPSIVSISNVTSVMDKYFGDEPSFTYSATKHILWMQENVTGPGYIHYKYRYDPNEQFDAIYDQQWVKEYSTALCRLQWGQIVGKYSQALVGGAQINYSDLQSQGQQELDRLNEELLSRWTEPCEIFIE